MVKRKTERKRLPVSVSATVFVENEQGHLLLVQQAAPWKEFKWGPSAGGMHCNETPAKTALREFRKELGVGVILVDLLGVYTAKRGPKTTGLGFIFRGRLKSTQFNPKKGEIRDARFFNPEEIQSLIDTGQIYKPEYNLPGIRDWLGGFSFPLEVIR